MSTSGIKDVAARAGVSVASVSRALSGRPGVSEATRRRVLLAARELDYRPDQIARSMRRRRSNLIGLVVSTIENVFFTEVARAAEQEARKYGFNLLIINTDEDIAREEASLAFLRQQLVSGVILAPAPGEIATRAYLCDLSFPLVLINRDPGDAPFSSVIADDEEAAYQCVRWLLRQGRRRIGVVSGIETVSTTRRRHHGFRRAHATDSIPIPDDLTISGNATFDGGYRVARDLMIRRDPPDSIFVHNNVMLMGTVLALQDLGLRWPNDIDVAGFGAFSAGRLYQPPLTLIAQPAREMGASAVSILLDGIEGRIQDGPTNLVLSNRLITRDDWVAQQHHRAQSVQLPRVG